METVPKRQKLEQKTTLGENPITLYTNWFRFSVTFPALFVYDVKCEVNHQYFKFVTNIQKPPLETDVLKRKIVEANFPPPCFMFGENLYSSNEVQEKVFESSHETVQYKFIIKKVSHIERPSNQAVLFHVYNNFVKRVKIRERFLIQ